MKHIKLKFIFSSSLIIFVFILLTTTNQIGVTRRLDNLHFTTTLDGQKILESIDNLTDASKNSNSTGQLKPLCFSFGKKRPLEMPLNKINTTNPLLANLWDNTTMVFGAAANGVGVGTGFALKKMADGRMLFLTNFHVVEQFCSTPQNDVVGIDKEDSFKFPCQSLFILHDVAINTKTNLASADGMHTWKSEVMSLDYFDKERDIAAFRIEIPTDNNLTATAIEKNYDLKKLLLARNTAEKIDPKLPPITVNGIDMSPMTAFTIYMAAYSMPKLDSLLIQKQWYKGAILGSQTFENDKKLGFITALKHNIEVLPGSSGAPIVLSDGRIIGINSSVEVKQYYERSGILWWVKYTLQTVNSYFAMPTTFLNDFYDIFN